MPPTLLPARPTSETGPTPHHTIPYHTASHHTTPPPPPIRVRQPPDVWKGPILILRSEFIYPLCVRVGERVYGSVMRACTRERISKRTANLWPRGTPDFSPRSSSGPPSRRRTSFRLPRGNPFPKFRAREVVLRTTPLLRTLAARFVAADWTMHGYVHDASPFANPGDPAVKSVRFDYLTVARKERDVDGSRLLRLTHHISFI